MKLSEIADKLIDCGEALKCSNHPFDAWEKEFIISAAKQFAEYDSLTEKQCEHLEKIWDKI